LQPLSAFDFQRVAALTLSWFPDALPLAPAPPGRFLHSLSRELERDVDNAVAHRNRNCVDSPDAAHPPDSGAHITDPAPSSDR